MPICDIKKGKNFHEFNGIKYDVDTFYDELAWEEICQDKRTKELYHKIWGYGKGCFPCPLCKRTDYMLFNIQATGVFAKCDLCKVTTGVPPMDPEDADKVIAELLESKPISVQEAYDIAKRIGTVLPPAMEKDKRPTRFGQKKAQA